MLEEKDVVGYAPPGALPPINLCVCGSAYRYLIREKDEGGGTATLALFCVEVVVLGVLTLLRRGRTILGYVCGPQAGSSSCTELVRSSRTELVTGRKLSGETDALRERRRRASR